MAAYLQLGRWVGRIWREQLEHVSNAADGPGAHAVVLVLQQAVVCQLLGDGHERLAVCIVLVQDAELVQQRLQSRQEVAHADLLSRAPDQRLLEPELLEAISAFLRQLLLLLLLLLLFDNLSRRCGAPPTARSHVAWQRVVSIAWNWCACVRVGVQLGARVRGARGDGGSWRATRW